LSGVGLWRCEPFEPKLKAFVQEARWLSDAGWRMGKAISRQCASAISVGPFCRKGFSKLPQGEPSAGRHREKQKAMP